MSHENAMLSQGSLFSGIGGFDLGFERAGFTTVWQVERDPYCQAVLAKHFPDAKRYADVRSVHGVLAHAKSGDALYDAPQQIRRAAAESPHPCRTDGCLQTPTILTGGFPCQPLSVAGKRRGIDDDRYLWPQMRRVIEEVRPRWVVAENVPGLIKLALDQVLSDLEALGYTVGAVTVPACGVDAPHPRERLWIVANAERERNRRGSREGASAGGTRKGERTQLREEHNDQIRDGGTDVADTAQQLFDRSRYARATRRQESSNRRGDDANPHSQSSGWIAEPRQEHRMWLPEPAICRVAYGIPHRVHRLRALGNAIVPHIAEEIGRMILAAEQGG